MESTWLLVLNRINMPGGLRLLDTYAAKTDPRTCFPTQWIEFLTVRVNFTFFIDRFGIPLGSQPIKFALARHTYIYIYIYIYYV